MPRPTLARALAAALTLVLPALALAQRTAPPPPNDTAAHPIPPMPGMADMPGMTQAAPASRARAATPMAMTMHAPEPLGVSMDRMGSGTTWIPAAVSLPSRHLAAGTWDLMLHGFAFAEYDVQGGLRGGHQVGSLNWGMLMASHALAGGRFQARTMLSLDAAGVSPRGYPLLLQSGEQYDGRPLHDRQHPHDLLMELGLMYERALSPSSGVSAYAAPSGEPALGPVAFMHRPSAMDVPTAPIGHHWQDATHISFGVLTAGLFGRAWKLEGSAFNGREPDQHRYDLERVRLDSYSGRATLNPSPRWSLTAGYGYVHAPEADEPGMSMHRAVGSAMYGAPLGARGQWSATAIWGANRHAAGEPLSHSALLEAEAVPNARWTAFGRAEWVEKSAADLSLDALDTPGDRRTPVAAFSLGGVREVVALRGATLGVGAMGTANLVPPALRDAYGSRTPLGAFLFVRVRPTWDVRPGAAMADMPGM